MMFKYKRYVNIPCDFNRNLNVWWNNKYINWSNDNSHNNYHQVQTYNV